ncbi:hypothetical protein ES319_A03G188700v1 [Gossypium barbadense]|uniref:OCRE domain-containing protein n=1 Tax=Gossypium barbadense TaxID=3634 RepID=A0A5J5WGQ6_GOSBA|nr:hypothetical protein ES319_A03G188700v1 [Gossypium barbadense]
MEEKPPSSHLKRPFFDDDDSNKPPAQKRIRFPKGKKVKPGEEAVNRVDVEDGSRNLQDPRLAAKERSKRRNQITTELFTEDGRGMLNDITLAEVAYEDNENFIDDGIQIEPFNLDKEREEGYFDADGNFVEYVNNNGIKDAWLDSVEADVQYTGKAFATKNGEDNEDVAQDLSAQDIGIIKRRIANGLEPGETVLQALRGLKGPSNNRKEKMSAETKRVFDQLTEDAVKLMENGDYNVYHEKQEAFQREADDEDDENLKQSSEANSNAFIQSSSNAVNTFSETGDVLNDYIYDESSGHYYSSTLGCYYDPSTGLYCTAASGQWYSFNQSTGTYDEVTEVASATN